MTPDAEVGSKTDSSQPASPHSIDVHVYSVPHTSQYGYLSTPVPMTAGYVYMHVHCTCTCTCMYIMYSSWIVI